MALMASVRRSQDPAVSYSVPRLNVVAVAILLGAVGIGAAASLAFDTVVPAIVFTALGLAVMPAPKIAQQWERAIVLRFGRYVGLRGPGLFWIVPFVDRVSSVIDQR